MDNPNRTVGVGMLAYLIKQTVLPIVEDVSALKEQAGTSSPKIVVDDGKYYIEIVEED